MRKGKREVNLSQNELPMRTDKRTFSYCQNSIENTVHRVQNKVLTYSRPTSLWMKLRRCKRKVLQCQWELSETNIALYWRMLWEHNIRYFVVIIKCWHTILQSFSVRINDRLLHHLHMVLCIVKYLFIDSTANHFFTHIGRWFIDEYEVRMSVMRLWDSLVNLVAYHLRVRQHYLRV